MMALSWEKFALLVIITSAFLHGANCQIEWTGSAEAFGTPELYTLIANSSATGNEQRNDMISLLQNQQQTWSQMVHIQAQMVQTQTQMLHTQTQIANTLGHVVSLLQMQGQQIQNMTATMNTMMSVLERQQEILENISRPLPVVLEQQANQIEILSHCQPRFNSYNICSNVEASRLQTTRVSALTSNPTATTPAKDETYDTTTLTASTSVIQDCSDLVINGGSPSNVYSITPRNGLSFNVFCDMDTTDGGWTVV